MQLKKALLHSAFLAALCALPLQAQAQDKAAGHCAPDETVIFSCPTADQQHISLCASSDYGPSSGFLQYRYGKAGKPELLVPEAKTAPAQAAQSGLWSFSRGGGAYVRFQKDGSAYYVYNAIGAWGEEGKVIEKSGVAVETKGAITASILCQGAATSELGPDFFDKAGLSEVEEEFELPD